MKENETPKNDSRHDGDRERATPQSEPVLPWVTPGSAEGDRATVEEDLREKETSDRS